MKKLIVLLIAATLTGCVNYTNDKGQKCQASLDPLAWTVGAAMNAAVGEDPLSTAIYCKPEGQ